MSIILHLVTRHERRMSAAGVSGSSIVIIIIIDVAPFSAPSRPLFKRCCGDGDAAAVTSLGKRRLWEDVCNACGKQTMRGRRTNKHSTDSRNAPLRQMNGDAGVWPPEGVVRRGGGGARQQWALERSQQSTGACGSRTLHPAVFALHFSPLKCCLHYS